MKLEKKTCHCCGRVFEVDVEDSRSKGKFAGHLSYCMRKSKDVKTEKFINDLERLALEGVRIVDIAERLGVSAGTVSEHLKRLGLSRRKGDRKGKKRCLYCGKVFKGGRVGSFGGHISACKKRVGEEVCKEKLEKLLAEGKTIDEIASEFGMWVQSLLRMIRKSYPDVRVRKRCEVCGRVFEFVVSEGLRGFSNHMRWCGVRKKEYEEGLKSEIRKLLDEGFKLTEISERLGVSVATVSNYVRRFGLRGV